MAAGALCMCGHREGQHSLGYCERSGCRCYQFEANTEVPVVETLPVESEPTAGQRLAAGETWEQVYPELARESKLMQTTTQRKTCQCGHREAVHNVGEGGDCRIANCSCDSYDEVPWTDTETQVKQRRAERGHGGSRTEAEPGSWRGMVEDLSTGAVYLVARGSKTFVSRSMTAYIDANPLPLTKRGVLSLDHEYVKARDDAPFFWVES